MVEQSVNGLKLNIGAGTTTLPGYVPIDRKQGGEAYPLRYNDGMPVADECADEVYAAHVLEHFGFREVEDVVREWVRVLKPGGRLRVAVPDLTHIAKAHLRRRPEPYLAYLMGAQTDEDDFHKSAFDHETLTAVLRGAGLVRIREWTAEHQDSSRHVCSLNLEGYKVNLLHSKHPLPKVHGVLSVPRLAFTANMFCALATTAMLGIPFRKGEGAYWDQCLERAITELLDDVPDLEYVLTMDYDTVFRHQDVLTLCDLAREHPEADAIAPIQCRRMDGQFMVQILQPDGTPYPAHEAITKAHYRGDLTRALTAHFGLTLLKAEKLRSLPHPWFKSVPAEDGTWGEGRVDADVQFWRHWSEHGHTLYLASRVPVGHAQLVITWPKEGGGIAHQSCEDFWNNIEPAGLWT